MTTYRDEALANGDTTRWLYDEPSGCMTNKLYADGKGPRYRGPRVTGTEGQTPMVE